MFLLILHFVVRTVGRVFLLPVIGLFSVSIENFAVLTVMGRVGTVKKGSSLNYSKRWSRGKHEGFRNTFYGDPIDRLDKARDDSALGSSAKLC